MADFLKIITWVCLSTAIFTAAGKAGLLLTEQPWPVLHSFLHQGALWSFKKKKSERRETRIPVRKVIGY